MSGQYEDSSLQECRNQNELHSKLLAPKNFATLLLGN
jgi:hypothetical protein